MGETTGIAWTDSTINVWHGCHKVDALCRNCYAEVSTPVRVKRAAGLEVWGASAARSETKGWEASLRKWQRAAAAHRAIYADPPSPFVWRVFGQSLSDTFEDRGDDRCVESPITVGRTTLPALRARFFAAIEAAPALTFQLLTKRPENITRMVPPSWLSSWPAHVWIGTSVGDQESADLRIPHLLRVPAAVRFLSVEPQLGPVDLRRVSFGDGQWGDALVHGDQIHWVIQGGESGSKARSFDLAWARSLRDQCRATGTAYFLKQLGARTVCNPKVGGMIGNSPVTHYDTVRLVDSHGGDESEWPADLQGCRSFPEPMVALVARGIDRDRNGR